MKPHRLSARVLSLLACGTLISGSASAAFAVDLPPCPEPNCLLTANHEGAHRYTPLAAVQDTQNSAAAAPADQTAPQENTSVASAPENAMTAPAAPSPAVSTPVTPPAAGSEITQSIPETAQPAVPPAAESETVQPVPTAPIMPEIWPEVIAPLPFDQMPPISMILPTIPQGLAITPDMPMILPEIQDTPTILPELDDTIPNTSTPQQQPCDVEGCQLTLGHEGDHGIKVEAGHLPDCALQPDHIGDCKTAVQLNSCPTKNCTLQKDHEGACLIPTNPLDLPIDDQGSDTEKAAAVQSAIKALVLPEGEISEAQVTDLYTRYQAALDAYKALSDAQKALLGAEVTDHLTKIETWLKSYRASLPAGFLVNDVPPIGILTLQDVFSHPDTRWVTLLENQTVTETLHVTHDLTLYGTQDEKSHSITLHSPALLSMDAENAVHPIIEVTSATLTLEGTYLDGGPIKIGENGKLRLQKTNVLPKNIQLADGVRLEDAIEFVDGGSLVINGQTYNKISDGAFGYTIDPNANFETDSTDTIYRSLQDAINNPDVTEITLHESFEGEALVVPASRTKPLTINGTEKNFKLGSLTVESPVTLNNVDIADLKSVEFTMVDGTFTIGGKSDSIPVYVMNEYSAMPIEERINKPSAAPIFTPVTTEKRSYDTVDGMPPTTSAPFDGFYYQTPTTENQAIKITRNGKTGYFTNVNNAIHKAQNGESITVTGKVFDNISIDLGEKNVQLSLENCEFRNMTHPAINIASNFAGSFTMTGSKILFAANIPADAKIAMKNDSVAAILSVKGNYWGAEKPIFSGSQTSAIQYSPYYNAPELTEDNKVDASQDLPTVLKKFEDTANQTIGHIESAKTLDTITEDWITSKTDSIRAQKNDLTNVYDTLLQESKKTFPELISADASYQTKLTNFAKLLGAAYDLDKPSVTKATFGLRMPTDSKAQDHVNKELSKLMDSAHPANTTAPKGLAASQVGLVSDCAKNDYFTKLTAVSLDKTYTSYATVGSGSNTQISRIFFTVEPKRTLPVNSSSAEEKITSMNGLSKVKFRLPVPSGWRNRIYVKQTTPSNQVTDSRVEVISEKGYSYIELELSEFGNFELSTNDLTPSKPDEKPKPDKEDAKKEEQKRQEKFWEDIEEDIRRAKDGDKIQINASSMDDFPVDLLRQISGRDITLVLDYDGNHAEIYGMDLPNLPRNARFMEFDQLFDLLEQHVADNEQPDVIERLPEMTPSEAETVTPPVSTTTPSHSGNSGKPSDDTSSKPEKAPKPEKEPSSKPEKVSSSKAEKPTAKPVEKVESTPENSPAAPTRGFNAAAAAAGVASAAAVTGGATCSIHFYRKRK